MNSYMEMSTYEPSSTIIYIRYILTKHTCNIPASSLASVAEGHFQTFPHTVGRHQVHSSLALFDPGNNTAVDIVSASSFHTAAGSLNPSDRYLSF